MMLQSYFAGIKYASKMIKMFYICCQYVCVISMTDFNLLEVMEA